MNKKVLKTVIHICWAFLICYAILKLFLAEQFVSVVNNDRIISVGRYIDSHTFLKQLVHTATSLLTYQFYLCACCRKWRLTRKQYIIAILTVVPSVFINWYLPMIGMQLSVILMFLLPYLFKATFKDTITIFIAHSVGQLLVAFIRSEPLNLIDVNIVTQLICTIDMYIWLVIYYLYSNIYKESIFMGSLAPPFWGDKSREIEKEIAKLDEKIAKTTDEEKLAKLKEMRAEYVSMLENTDKN